MLIKYCPKQNPKKLVVQVFHYLCVNSTMLSCTQKRFIGNVAAKKKMSPKIRR